MQSSDAPAAAPVDRLSEELEIVPESHNYNEAFELTGYGCMNRWVLVACSLIFVHASQEMTGIAYVSTLAQCDLNLSVGEAAMVNSAVFLGIVSTSILWGNLCDRLGRRKIIVPTIIGSILTSFSSSLSTNFWLMFSFRFLTGVLVSATSATVLVYLGEMHIKKYRDSAMAVAVASDQINFVVFPGYAWAIVPREWSFYIGQLWVRPWRVFMWFWAITGCLGCIVLFFLPESPRFVLANYGNADALGILANIYAINLRKRPEDYPVKKLRATISVMSMGKSSFKALFKSLYVLMKPPLRRCYILTHYCMFLTCLLSNGLYIWMPDILNEVMKDTSSKSTMCSLIYKRYMDVRHVVKANDDVCSQDVVEQSMYPVSIAMEFCYLIPYVIVIILITKVSPIKIYVAIMSCCAVGLSLCFLIPQVIGATIAISIGLCSGSCASVLSALAIDAFPTKLRALAMCTMYMVGQFGTVVGITLVSFMNGVFCQIIFTIVSFNAVFSAFVLYKFWPDLEEVQDEMEAHNYTY